MDLIDFLTSWLSTGLLLLDVFIIATLLPTVVQQRRETGATLAWVLTIVLLPFIGLLSFWLFGVTRLHLRRRKRRKVEEKLARALERVQVGLNGEQYIAGISPSLLTLVNKLDDIGPLAGNAVEIMREGEALFDALESAFDNATQHIHLVYYIWEKITPGRACGMRWCGQHGGASKSGCWWMMWVRVRLKPVSLPRC